MIITTTPTIEGHPIKDYKGLVVGEVIMGANVVRDLFASITDVIGGRSGVYESKLADADWVKDPDVEVFLKETGVKIFGEIEKFGNAEGAGHLAVLKSVTCTGEETGDGLQITIDLGTGDPKETVLFQEVEGKWLPKDWVDQWPVWMAAARAVVAEPEVAPGVPDRQKILASQLQGLESALDQLSDRELAGQLGQVLKGMLEDDALPEPEEEPAAP